MLSSTKARVIALTMPVVDEIPGHAEIVPYVARVSNPGNQLNFADDRLMKYLIRKEHWSPFEMVHIVMEVKTTRDIARQVLRHRSFTFQEFSQRYAVVTEDFIRREARLQDDKNRQNSIETDDNELQIWWDTAQQEVATIVDEIYSAAINKGVAKEVARAVLPEGMTPSTFYMAGSLRSWIHYIKLRSSNGTQKEHMIVAELCKAQLLNYYPNIEGVFECEQPLQKQHNIQTSLRKGKWTTRFSKFLCKLLTKR